MRPKKDRLTGKLVKYKRIFFYYKKPKFGIYVLHNLQLHPTGFQTLILDLNSECVLEFLIFKGTKFHVLGPRYDRDSMPYLTVLILLVGRVGPLLKLQVVLFTSKMFFHNSRAYVICSFEYLGSQHLQISIMYCDTIILHKKLIERRYIVIID